MRSVTLSLASSLDGYIARRDGTVDWLIMDPKLGPLMAKFFKSIDVVVAGRKTLDAGVAQGHGGASMPGMTCYIFSHSLPPGKRNGAEYVNRPPSELIRELKAKPGKDIWLMGGGELARSFLQEDLVDRIDLGIMPILLGDGVPLFPSGFPQRDFRLASHQSFPSGVLALTYTRAPAIAGARKRGKRPAKATTKKRG